MLNNENKRVADSFSLSVVAYRCRFDPAQNCGLFSVLGSQVLLSLIPPVTEPGRVDVPPDPLSRKVISFLTTCSQVHQCIGLS